MKNARVIISLAVIIALVAAGVIVGPELVEKVSYSVAKGANAANREALAKLSQQEQLSKIFRLVARTIKPSVVVVKVKKRVALPEMPDLEEFFKQFEDDPFFGPRFKFFRRLPKHKRERFFLQRGLGSGVIVDAKNGYILTNYHVVGGADEVEVILPDGRKFDTEWIRGDPQTDVAVVKIKAKRLIAAPLGDSDKMQVGDWVLAIGAPEGLPQTVTAGIISAKGRKTGIRSYENFIQTDAAINHGNSGGPLVNLRGEVIGINTAIVTRSGANEGIGLAIPSNMAKEVMQQLIEKGKVVRGFLGVTIQDVDEELAKSFNLPDTHGALVTRVLKGSPADKAGIKEEDFIVEVDGKKVKDVDDLRIKVARLTPGSKVKIKVYRNGKPKIITVKIGTQPADMVSLFRKGHEKVSPKEYGIEVQTLTSELAAQYGYDEDTKGVLILSVAPDSDAAEKGITPGLVIDRVNGKSISDVDDFAAAIAAAKGKSIRLRVISPDGFRRYVVISPK